MRFFENKLAQGRVIFANKQTDFHEYYLYLFIVLYDFEDMST